MPIKGDQRAAFNKALREVTITNKQLVLVYQEALDDITKEIAVLKEQIERGFFANGQARRAARLEKLYKEVEERITQLYAAQGRIITSGWTTNYVDTYYQIGFALEKEINVVTLPEQGATFDYSLNYRRVNPAFATSELNTIIAGFTFRERQGIDRALMQARVRDIINNAVVEGLTPQDVAKELRKVDNVFTINRNKAITTARTELLRAYSIAAEESNQIAQDRGVESEKIWDATLDGRTRPQHARMDQKKADEQGLFRLPNGDRALGPRMPGLSAGNAVNCRCRAVYVPQGVRPNTRGSRLANGDWQQVNADLTWQEWARTLEGQATIEKTREDRRERARRARERRN